MLDSRRGTVLPSRSPGFGGGGRDGPTTTDNRQEDTMTTTTNMTSRLRDAITTRRPQNGWITSAWILDGWTAQPAYGTVRS